MPMLCTDQNSFGPGLSGSAGGRPQSMQELAVLVELGHARAGVAVGDEERPVGQPGDVGGPIEVVRTASRHAALAHRLHQLAVVGEDVDLVHVVVDDPDVLFRIVRVDQQLVRAARHLAESGASVRARDTCRAAATLRSCCRCGPRRTRDDAAASATRSPCPNRAAGRYWCGAASEGTGKSRAWPPGAARSRRAATPRPCRASRPARPNQIPMSSRHAGDRCREAASARWTTS